jgi:hypothetical protein
VFADDLLPWDVSFLWICQVRQWTPLEIVSRNIAWNFARELYRERHTGGADIRHFTKAAALGGKANSFNVVFRRFLFRVANDFYFFWWSGSSLSINVSAVRMGGNRSYIGADCVGDFLFYWQSALKDCWLNRQFN